MRVLIACPRYVRAGNLKYFQHLVRNMAQLEGVDLHVIVNSSQAEAMLEFLKQECVHSFAGSQVKEGRFINKLLEKVDFDLLHFPCTLLPLDLKTSIPTVCTIHDLNFLTISQGLLKDVYKRLLYKRAYRASGLIYISDYSKTVYESFQQRKPKRSAVIHQGCERSAVRSDQDESKTKVRLLCFGHRTHKNPDAALRILALLDDKYQLDIIGNASGKRIGALIDELGVRERVNILEGVSLHDLNSLYSNALSLIFLSKYEGFGLPIIEAMTHGCPVITHLKFSCAEVAGDAGIYVTDDPLGYASAAETIARLRNNDSYRQAIRERCLSRATAFSWQRTASETLAFFREVVSARG